MSKLLIEEQPLIVIKSLALKIGLHEAIVLQQVHYWLTKKTHMIDGRSWVYNTYKEWQEQIPFWSESTIKRTFKTLEELGLIITGNYNTYKMDQTKWYTIDYEKLRDLDVEDVSTPEPEAHAEPADEEVQEQEKEIQVAEVVKYLNEKTYSSFKSGSGKTSKLIAARWKEGFRLDDFKKVIDRKAADWLNHPKWEKYLRPETLFGTKFESYLNQKPARNRIIREEDFNFDDEA